MEYAVSLIYFWLKENHLLKTCRSLEQEYGEAITVEPEGTSLKNIIQTYQSLFVLVSSLVNPVQQTIKTTEVPKGDKKSTSKNIVRRQKNSTKKESIVTEGKSSSSADTNKKNVNVIVTKKKEKKPFMPPGVWVCPEMENTLFNVYERNTPSIDLNNVNKNVIDISQHETSSKDTDDNNNSNNKNNRNEKVGNPDLLPGNNKVISKVLQNEEMFTSDSESDSEADFQLTKTAVKLCNGVVLESPCRSKNKTTNKTERKGDEHTTGKQEMAPEKIIVDNSVENNYVKIKEMKKKNDRQPVELDEIEVKKKKSKMLLPNISPVFNDSNEVNDFMVKKKKKRKSHDIEDIYNGVENGIVESPEVVTGVKKKKKKHKSSIEDIHNGVINDTDQIPETSITVKKKKKKSKLESEKENEPMMGTEIMEEKKQKFINSEEAENEIILKNLGAKSKKKKKKNIE